MHDDTTIHYARATRITLSVRHRLRVRVSVCVCASITAKTDQNKRRSTSHQHATRQLTFRNWKIRQASAFVQTQQTKITAAQNNTHKRLEGNKHRCTHTNIETRQAKPVTERRRRAPCALQKNNNNRAKRIQTVKRVGHAVDTAEKQKKEDAAEMQFQEIETGKYNTSRTKRHTHTQKEVATQPRRKTSRQAKRTCAASDEQLAGCEADDGTAAGLLKGNFACHTKKRI